MSGVFWRCADHGVLVPIEDGVFLVRELSIPSTASGVGRIAYGEGVAMSSGCVMAGVSVSGSRAGVGMV